MKAIERIPLEARWKLGALAFSALPLAYRARIGGQMDERFNTLEQEIWRERGRETSVIASAFGLSPANARDVAEVYDAVSQLYFGPEIEGEILERAGDTAQIIRQSCPLLQCAAGTDTAHACNICHSFSKSAVESMGAGYAIHFSRGMCAGDRNCELVIGKG